MSWTAGHNLRAVSPEATSSNPQHSSYPLRVLNDTLHYEHFNRAGRYHPALRGKLTKSLFSCLWEKPEWRACFFEDPNDESVPSTSGSSGWMEVDEDGFERPWRLSDHQAAVDQRRKEAGKQPIRQVPVGKTCGKVLQRFDRTYLCKTCSIDIGCVLCVDCFNASSHRDHEITFSQTYAFSVTCDCGDVTAFLDNEHLGCAHHPRRPPGATIPNHPKWFITDTPIPQDLVQQIYETLVICLEFVIRAFQTSPLPADYTRLPKDLETMKEGDVLTSAEDAEGRAKGPWSVVLYSDDKHVQREVARQIRDALGVSLEIAERCTREIEQMGRKVLTTTHNPLVAFHAASMFQQIDMGVLLRHAYDVFKEEEAGAIIAWMYDMCNSHICGDPDVFKRILAKALLDTPQSGQMRHIMADDLADLRVRSEVKRIDWLMRLDVRMWKKAKWHMRQVYSSVFGLGGEIRDEISCRFAFNYHRIIEHFLFQDREPDVSLMSGISYLIMGNGMACVAATARNDLLGTVVDLMQAWYTRSNEDQSLHLPTPGAANDESPESRSNRERGLSFKNKKGIHLFAHLRGLLLHKEIQQIIVSDPGLFLRVVQFLNLFVGMQAQTRELTDHIQYEVEWIKTFSLLGELAKTARELGECFTVADTPERLINALSIVAQRILLDISLLTNTLDPAENNPPSVHEVQNVLIPGSSYTLIDENCLEIEGFSFHHYLHYLFAELLKAVPTVIDFSSPTMRGLTFPELIEKFVLQPQTSRDADHVKLLLIENPMQKIVVTCQIRADLWKRNGNTMRSQFYSYRDTQNREQTIDQEFLILQLGLCLIEPAKFMTALIDRFGLALFFSWDVISGDAWRYVSDRIDPRSVIIMMEDFMSVVIWLAADTDVINGATQEQKTRKLIVQQLALHNLAYSELYKKLPDRSTAKGSILGILTEVADFRPPTETTVGSYSLKAEAADEIDPFWRHYNRNEQGIATERVLSRMKQLDPDNPHLFVKPRPLKIPSGNKPFANLAAFLETPIAAKIVHYVLGHALLMANPEQWPARGLGPLEDPQYEHLVNLALHLTLLALERAPRIFASASVEIVGDSNCNTVFQNLWLMQSDATFKTFKPKVDYIMKIIVSRLPASFTADYRAQMEQKDLVMSPKHEDAKLAAAARQKAIMAEFAKKQADFAAFMDEEDEEDDENIEEQQEVTSYGQCIVCQEDVTAKRAGGMLALLQPSRIIREAAQDRDWFEETLETPSCLDNATRYPRHGQGTTGERESTDGYPSTSMRFGVYISACSHLMHEECMSTYFDATRVRHTHQVQRNHPENAVRFEYLCPLCKSVGNMIIPVEPSEYPLKPASFRYTNGKPPQLSEMIRRISEEGLKSTTESTRIWDHHVETGELSPWFCDSSFYTQSLDPNYRRQHLRQTARMIERFRNLFRSLSEQSQRLRGKVANMYVPDQVVAYTVSVCEVAQRGMGRNGGPESGLTVAEQVPELQMKLIKQLIGALRLELDLYFGINYDRTHLRVGLFALFMPEWYRQSTLPSPLLLRNPISIVVETAAIAPDLLQPIILMGYYVHLTRTILGLPLIVRRSISSKGSPPPPTPLPDDPYLPDALKIFAKFRPFVQSILRSAGPFNDTDAVLSLLSDEVLSKLLYTYTLPYLRRAAIIYYAAAGTYPVTDPASIITAGCEYDRLLSLLGIGRPRETLSNPNSTITPIVSGWLNHWAQTGRVLPILEFPGIYELLRLPKLWEELVLRYQNKRCDQCGHKPTYPAICMYCGQFLCLGGDCCSEGEQGECNIHMRDCGAATGMFIDIKRWVILLLYAGSGSFTSMPYLDTHGELDLSMRRGHRQILHRGRFDELRKAAWLQHSIPHIIARRLELTSDGGGWGCL